MEQLALVQEWISMFIALPMIWQIIITVSSLIYIIITMRDYFQYEQKIKNHTIYSTMDFFERRINEIVQQSVTNCENIIFSTGNFTEADRLEIDRYSDRLKLSALEVKHKFKNYLRLNGYYDLYNNKDKEFSAKKLETLYRDRATELKNDMTSEAVKVLRDSSKLINKAEERFRLDIAIETYRTVISYHCGEIRNEENNINKWIKKRIPIPLLNKIIRYKHS
jgi:hypothetical protein